MKYPLFIFLFISLIGSAQQPSLQFAKELGQTGNEITEGKRIQVDRTGNIYSIGYLTGIGDFDPSSSGSFTMNATNGNVYISKLDPVGNFVWAKQFQTNEDNYLGFDLDMIVDTIGNVFMAGIFTGTVDLDPGPGSFTATSSMGAYVTKLDNNGNFIWGKILSGTSGLCTVKSLVLDTAGNVLLTGNFSQVVDFDPSLATTYTLSAGTDYNPFILKLDPSGNFLWVKQIIGSGNNSFSGFAITIDKNNCVYTSGGFQCVADFNPSTATYTLDATDNYRQYVTKFDPNGNFIWATCFGDGYFIGGGAIYNISNSIRVDNTGAIYTGGNSYGKVDFDPGPFIAPLGCNGCYSMYLSKLNNAGNFIWAKEFSGLTYDSWLNALEIDNMANIYVIGALKGTFDFDPGAPIFNLTSGGQNDIYLTKLNSGGALQWAIQMGDTSRDAGNGVFVDRLNYIYSTGKYRYNSDFDPNSGTFLMPSASQNAFVQKLCQGCITGERRLEEPDTYIGVFPNPAQNEFVIEFVYERDLANPTELKIVDVVGKEVKNVFITDTKQKIDVSDLKNGAYYVIISNNNNDKIVKKLVIGK